MSHTDDPTVEAREQGENGKNAFLSQIPEGMTQSEFLETIKSVTGKTEDEMLSMESSELQTLIDQSFDNKGGGKKPADAPKKPDDAAAEKKDDDAGKTAAKADEKPPAEEEEVSVTIKPSLLKPFSTGKELKDAIAEAVRRAQENESTVEVFQKQTIPNLRKEIETQETRINQIAGENTSLKKDLEELRKQKADGKTDGKPDEELPPIPEIPDEFDPLDPEHRESMLNAINVLRKRDEILTKRAAAPKSEPTQPAAPAGDQPAKTQSQQDQTSVDEFNEVRMIQNNSAVRDYFKTSRDIADINMVYVEFGKKLAQMVGIQTVFDQSGIFSPATSQAIAKYFNMEDPEGESLRAAARKQGIEPPPDSDMLALKRITALRAVQRERTVRDGQGNAVPIPAEEAYAIAMTKFPHLFNVKDPLATRREEHEAMERAVANRAKHTTDVPPSIGADADNLAKIPVDALLKILNKSQDKWTVEEAELVKKTAKANGLSDEEIKFYVEQQKQ
jgi:hypothetical protein